MKKVFRYRVKGHKSRRLLNQMATAVNEVWNFCNDTQRTAVRRRRPWLSGYDLNALTDGAGTGLGLGAQTVQAVGQQYALARRQQGRPWLRYRGKRSLGWVPFKGAGIKQVGDGFKFRGHIFRVWLSREVLSTIRSGSFAQDARGHWYINLCVKVDDLLHCGSNEVGIDLGLKTTATMSNGQKYDGLRPFREVEPKLAIAQRAKKKRRVQTLHAKARNRRLDAHHKFTTQLANENKRVVIGTVSSKALAKTRMAKSVHDAGWGLLRGMLRYKTLARRAAYVEVDEAYSSQLCSACGTLPKSRPRGIAQLGVREWVCSNCGQGHDRDINAARNILALGAERPAEGILAL